MYHSPGRRRNVFARRGQFPAVASPRGAALAGPPFDGHPSTYWPDAVGLAMVRPDKVRETGMIDFALQRKNMVESQVRPSDVTDRRIVRAMLEVPREAFVPQAYKTLAYMDDAVRVSEASGPGGATR